VKIQPSLLLTHFCILLATAGALDAQSPQPRFGYGSVPSGAYVIPAPKKIAQPGAAVKAKPKPAPVSSPAKPKVTASTKTSAKPAAARPAAVKTATAKAVTKPPVTKPGTTGTSPKAVASTKTNATPPPAKPAPKTQLAKTLPTTSRSKSPALSAKTAPQPAIATRASSATPSVGSQPAQIASKKVPATTVVVAAATSASHSGLPDLTPPASGDGFHFFGAPVPVPDIAPGPTGLPPADSRHLVNAMAARHSLEKAVSQPPVAPAARPVQTAFVPAIAPRAAEGHKFQPAESARETITNPVKPAGYSLTTRSMGLSDSSDTFAQEQPAIRGANGIVASHAAPAPAIAPQPLAPQNFHPSDPLASTSPVDISEEPTFSRSIPASLSFAVNTPSKESAPEATLLDEPALPAPELAVNTPPEAPPTETKPSQEIEPPLPTEAVPSDYSSLEQEITKTTDENDLSERERAFVRSLAEAAGNVTTASGQLNTELPSTIATAATAVIDQIPAETVSTFRSVAATAKKAAKKIVTDPAPELPMEISTDLMPANPEKMPDRLPDFDAPASGKIDVQSDRQADYDQANNKVIFTGKVELNSAAMRLRAERVEVFMKKGGGGMERVEATGNVLMRTQDTANGPGQMASAGRASYNLKTGEITLSDWPKIQETGKAHISTDPSTKMYMFTDGRLRTDGPNRTIIGG
jgi:lipopolysaccharide transport protein LptA